MAPSGPMATGSQFRCEKQPNELELIEPLLGSERSERGPTKQIFDDTVDFGTVSTASISHSHSSSISMASSIELIDNTKLVYIPIKLDCGNQVYCAPDVLTNCPMVLRSLQSDLIEILRILPWSVHPLVKRTNIWINTSYAYGSKDDPKVLRHSTAHHGEGWLIECAKDRPEKARGIEIYSCFDFERMRLHWNGCGLILHEFCHLIHQFCLGLDCEKVEELYTEACTSGRYDKTLRRDWAGRDEDWDMAYALVDFKEFFAEISVTYLSIGYTSLDKADKDVMEACCPPLLEPNVTKRVLRMHEALEDPYESEPKSNWLFLSTLLGKHRNLMRGPQPKVRMVNPLWQEAAIARGCKDVKHCNKFYPFTRGQLKEYDPELFAEVKALWNEIAMYDDPLDERTFCTSLRIFISSLIK